MLGNQLSDFSELQSGTYGTVYYLSLSAQRVREVKLVTLSSGAYIASETAMEELSTLLGYTESESCPDMAIHQKGSTLFVFAKDSVYPDTSYIGITMTRNAIPADNTSDKADIPDDAQELFYNIAAKKLLEDAGGRVGYDIEQKIITEKIRLGI